MLPTAPWPLEPAFEPQLCSKWPLEPASEPKPCSKWPLEPASETQPRSKWPHEPSLHRPSGARHGILFGRAVDTADIHRFGMQLVRTNECAPFLHDSIRFVTIARHSLSSAVHQQRTLLICASMCTPALRIDPSGSTVICMLVSS